MMTEPLNCPYCDKLNELGIPSTPLHHLAYCVGCGHPFVVGSTVVTVYYPMKIEGIAPPADLVKCDGNIKKFPTMEEVEQDLKEHTCIECGHIDTEDNETFYPVGDGYLCEMCYQIIEAMNREEEAAKLSEAGTLTGTQPDPSQFLCDSCGTLNDIREKHVQPNGEKWCVSCIGRDMEDKHVEEPKKKDITFQNIAGTKVWYSIQGETVHLKYNNTKCGAWDRTIFDYMAELPVNKQDAELKELVKDLSCAANRKTALRQFLYALERGDVEFEEAAA